MVMENGQLLPEITGKDASGAVVSLGDLVRGSWGAVLLYRGHW